jgi:LAO/AO transport system kinase
VTKLDQWRHDNGLRKANRAAQVQHWFQEELQAELIAQLTRNPGLRERLAALEQEVIAGRLSPAAAATAALAPLLTPRSDPA